MMARGGSARALRSACNAITRSIRRRLIVVPVKCPSRPRRSKRNSCRRTPLMNLRACCWSGSGLNARHPRGASARGEGYGGDSNLVNPLAEVPCPPSRERPPPNWGRQSTRGPRPCSWRARLISCRVGRAQATVASCENLGNRIAREKTRTGMKSSVDAANSNRPRHAGAHKNQDRHSRVIGNDAVAVKDWVGKFASASSAASAGEAKANCSNDFDADGTSDELRPHTVRFTGFASASPALRPHG